MSLVTEVATPQYHLLLHLWMTLFGTSLFALRFLSLIFGVFATIIIYLLGRRLFNEEVGLISALILAISPLNIEYSQEARICTASWSSWHSSHVLLRPTPRAGQSAYFTRLHSPRAVQSPKQSLYLTRLHSLHHALVGGPPIRIVCAQCPDHICCRPAPTIKTTSVAAQAVLLSQVIAVIVFIPEIHFLLSKQAYAATNYVSFSYANPISLVLPLAAGRWVIPRQHCLDDTSPWVGCILTVHLPKSSTESF